MTSKKFLKGQDVRIGSFVGWNFINFSVQALKVNKSIYVGSNRFETCIILLTGNASFSGVNERKKIKVQSRSDIFEGVPPGALYVGCEDYGVLTAITDCDICIASAPSSEKIMTRLLPTLSYKQIKRGSGETYRVINPILPEEEFASSLIISETFTRRGNWSSYPPHKHDTHIQNQETDLHEIYHYRFQHADGKAMQAIYNRADSEAYLIRDGETVAFTQGYHPVAVFPRSDCYYLNVMVGPIRKWIVSFEDE